MTPAVGQNVHYVIRDHTEACHPAVVVAVHPSEGAGTLADLRGPQEVDLALLDPGGRSFGQVRHSEGARTTGTWHWGDDAC